MNFKYWHFCPDDSPVFVPFFFFMTWEIILELDSVELNNSKIRTTNQMHGYKVISWANMFQLTKHISSYESVVVEAMLKLPNMKLTYF